MDSPRAVRAHTDSSHTDHTNARSPLLLSEREAAHLLGVSPRTMFNLAGDPESGITPVRIYGRKLYSREALEAWIAERTTTGGT